MILRTPTRAGSRLLTNISECSWAAAKQSLALGTEDVRSVTDSWESSLLCQKSWCGDRLAGFSRAGAQFQALGCVCGKRRHRGHARVATASAGQITGLQLLTCKKSQFSHILIGL